MPNTSSLTSWVLDHIEKAAFGISLCGFGLLLYYYTNKTPQKELHNPLIGAGLIGAVIGVYLWVRRRSSIKGKEEREICLTITNKQDEWRDIMTVLREIWGFGQLLYFATHSNTKPISKYLHFNYYLQFTLFNIPSLPPHLIFLLSCFIPICLAATFFFGWAIHTLIPFLKRRDQLFIAMGEEERKVEQENENHIIRWENKRRKKWNQFKCLLLKGASIFYVGIFTQILMPLACIYDREIVLTEENVHCMGMQRFSFIACSVVCVILVFPCNTYLLTIGIQPPLKSTSGEIIFISDSVLTFTLAELICSAVKVFFNEERHQIMYLMCIAGIYAALLGSIVYGRATKKPACNSKAMFYFKVTNLACSLAFTLTNLVSGYFSEFQRTFEFALLYVVWPCMGAAFSAYLLTFCRNNSQAFMFSLDFGHLLRDRMIGCSFAVDNDSRLPPRYHRMDMLAVFDPRGTPFHSSMALFDKKYALVAPYSSTLGPLFKDATIIPWSHITEPLTLDQFKVTLLAGEINRRYVRKDLRKFLKVSKPEEYSRFKHQPRRLYSMMDLAAKEFLEEGEGEDRASAKQLLKISYPHLYIFLLEQRFEPIESELLV